MCPIILWINITKLERHLPPYQKRCQRMSCLLKKYNLQTYFTAYDNESSGNNSFLQVWLMKDYNGTENGENQLAPISNCRG